MKENKPEHIDEHILLQYLLGNLDDHERKVVEEWLQHSQENRKLLAKLETLWLEAGKISPAPVAVDTDAAWEKISGKIEMEKEFEGTGPKTSKGRSIRMTWYFTGIAATLLLIFGFYFLFNEILPPGKQKVIESLNRITPDTLPDGSVIILNRQSRLTRPGRFGSGSREVALSGEASCNIVHSPGRPFIIDCGRAKIRVLGTRFHVRAYPGEAVTVVVKEGLVLFFTLDSITGDTSGIRLGSGMKGVLKKESRDPEIMNAGSGHYSLGYEEPLDYKETPLRVVLDDLSRIFGTEIRVSDSAIHRCRLTASFSGEPLEQVLRVISATFDLELKKTDETYLLTGNGCSKKTD